MAGVEVGRWRAAAAASAARGGGAGSAVEVAGGAVPDSSVELRRMAGLRGGRQGGGVGEAGGSDSGPRGPDPGLPARGGGEVAAAGWWRRAADVVRPGADTSVDAGICFFLD